MTVIELAGINKVRKKLANGKVAFYYYHRATGKRLPGLPGSADFYDAYREADRIAPRDTGTVAELIRLYLASPKFAEEGPLVRLRSRGNKKKNWNTPLKAGTQREYKRMLTPLEAEFGNMPIAALAAPRVRGKFIDYQEEVGCVHPREADNRMMVMSAVFSYALYKTRITRNPLLGFNRMYDGDRSDIIWLEADVDAFMKDAPVELKLALILAIHTGQRYGDLVRLRWSDYDGEYISLKQEKTNARVRVRVSAALKRVLDSTKKACPYILARGNGFPWHTEKDDSALSREWREHMDTANLRGNDYLANTRDEAEFKGVRLHFNDLRGTAVTLLAQAGCTIPEIVSITGHTLENATRIIEKYMARTKSLSDAAISKFEKSPTAAYANRLTVRAD
jgi:integrase